MNDSPPEEQSIPEQTQAPQAARIPLFDSAQSPPWVTYTIMALTILVFLAQLISEAVLGGDLPAALGMKINDLIAQGQLWRLFTPMLLHGGLLHIGFNMYALFAIGPFLEKAFGARRFLLLYLVSGFAGNVISFIFTDANSLGASTAIFGIFGAQGIFIYLNRELFGSRSREMINRIVTLAVINLLIGLQGNIDNWGHIGGLLGGVVFTWFAGPVLVAEGIYPQIRLRDNRSPGIDLVSSLGLGLVFAIIALLGISLQ